MTLRARLVLSLVIIGGVLLVPLYFAYQGMEEMQGDIRDLRQHEFLASLKLGGLREELSNVRSREIALDAVKSDTVLEQFNQALNKATLMSNALSNLLHDSSSKRIAADLAAIRSEPLQEYAATKAGNQALVDSLSKRITGVLSDADAAVLAAETNLRARTQNRVQAAEDAVGQAADQAVLALGIGLVLAGAVAIWLTRSVSTPVSALEKGMAAVANGELSHGVRIDTTRGDEFGRLAVSFEEMTRQLRELDKLKAEFVSIASHELKTPINVILGYISLLQEGVYGALTEKQSPIVKTVESQARTLGKLAAQLLDVSRFEAGGGRIEPRQVHLSTMLDDLERTFHVLAVQRDVKFEVTREEGLPDTVNWDPERINEVTGNLLSNAFKFTEPGGRIELTAGPHENGVCIEVRDSGAGIPPEQLKRVFEKFYQADNQQSASAKGTGLGLAIAKEIVEAHQGHITCQSKLGEGTTFTIVLPLKVVDRRRSHKFKLAAK